MSIGEVCENSSISHISAASIYMAIKMTEKKSHGQLNIINKALFSKILEQNSCSTPDEES
jgi:hypothetical protein